MGDAEGHRSGMEPAVAQVWGVRAGQGSGKTHGILCCSGNVLAAQCLLCATSSSSKSSREEQSSSISTAPNKQDELLATAQPRRNVFWLRCVARYLA